MAVSVSRCRTHIQPRGGDMGKVLYLRAAASDGTPPAVTLADEDPVLTYIKSHAPGKSRWGIEYRLKTAGRLMGYEGWQDCPWETWTRHEVQALRAVLVEKVDRDEYVPRTANTVLSVVKGALTELWRQGLMGTDEYHRAVDFEPVPGKRRRRPKRAVTDHEFTRLLAVCELVKTERACRDALVFALASTVYLRAKEYCDLTLSDLDLEARTLRIREGKGDEERYVPLEDSVLPYLERYLDLRGRAPGPLLCATHRGGRLLRPLRDIAPASLSESLGKWAAPAGVPPFTSHATRRGGITRSLDATGNLPQVSKIAGHSTPALTQEAYYNPTLDTLRETAHRAAVPVPWLRTGEASGETADAGSIWARIAATVVAMQGRGARGEGE